MKSSETFKKLLLPKIVLIIFFLIAYEIITSFPFMSKVLWGHYVSMWVHLLLNIALITIIISAVPGLRNFAIAMISESMKEKYEKWSGTKKASFTSIITNLLYVIVVFISYSIISDDITRFLGGGAFDTIARIVFLVGGLYLLYQAYVAFNNWLNEKSEGNIKDQS